MPARKSTEEFVKKSKIKHNNFYSYEQTEYQNVKAKVIITCPEHGDFFQSPNDHLNGCGCSKCGKETYRKKMMMSLDEFIRRAKIVHTEKYYDFSKIEYFGSLKDAKIYCRRHGFTNVKAVNFIRGHGCKKCGNNQLTFKEFTKKANTLHNYKYDYSMVIWQDKITNKIPIICPKHGEFWQSANKHINDGVQGCPQCKHYRSKGEKKWLDSLNIKGLKKGFRIQGVGNVDGFNPETNTIYEYHGKFWHGHPDFCDPFKKHPLLEGTFQDVYNRSCEKDKKIQNAGYNLIIKWE